MFDAGLQLLIIIIKYNHTRSYITTSSKYSIPCGIGYKKRRRYDCELDLVEPVSRSLTSSKELPGNIRSTI